MRKRRAGKNVRQLGFGTYSKRFPQETQLVEDDRGSRENALVRYFEASFLKARKDLCGSSVEEICQVEIDCELWTNYYAREGPDGWHDCVEAPRVYHSTGVPQKELGSSERVK